MTRISRKSVAIQRISEISAADAISERCVRIASTICAVNRRVARSRSSATSRASNAFTVQIGSNTTHKRDQRV